MTFEHSVKVPRLYKVAAKILQEVKENRKGLKELVYQSKHCNIKGIYALVAETLKHFSEIDTVIEKSELLIKESRFDPWLARILITELLWKGKQLNSDCKPIKIIRSYYDVLEKYKLIIDSKAEPKIVNKVQKPRFVRINTLAVTLEEAINGFRDEGWNLVRFPTENYDDYVSKSASLGEDEFMIDLHIKELLLFPFNTQFHKHLAYKMGSIILQDKASCLPAYLLNPTPGSSVLDMCAAPGMKTTHVAALLNNEGIIYAVERDQRRFETLNKMIENAGATCVKTINKDVLRVTSEDCPNVEYILVDPTCSGSGMTERIVVNNEDEETSRGRLGKLSGFQVVILTHALTHFPKAKRVVYSTCSIYTQENEYVVSEVLKNNPKFKLVCAKSLLNGPWKNSNSENWDDITDKCLSTRPEKDLTNGFFIAVFERDQSQGWSESENDLENATAKKGKKGKEISTAPFNQSMLNVEEEPCEFEENGQTEKLEKKHKKKGKPVVGGGDERIINDAVTKIKHKKMKTKVFDEEQDTIGIKKITNDEEYDGDVNDDLIFKKKKEKETKGKEKVQINTENNTESSENVNNRKNKKKKKEHLDMDEIENNEELCVITDPQKKHKKKKHNKNINFNKEEHNEFETIANNDVMPQKKNKKKKRATTKDDDVKNTEQLSSSSASMSKQKDKKKENVEIEEEVNKMLETHKKCKKKKRDKTTDHLDSYETAIDFRIPQEADYIPTKKVKKTH